MKEFIDPVLFLQESSKVKVKSSLHEIWNADIAFLLGGAALYLSESDHNPNDLKFNWTLYWYYVMAISLSILLSLA